MNDMFDGPYGLWGISMNKGYSKGIGPFRCTVTDQDSFYLDERGIISVYDGYNTVVADAWLSKQAADEREQAVQWFTDVVGAAYCTEVTVIERRTR